jgi:aryl sulfotransferase
MQHIVGMMVFKSAEPRSVADVSPWPDFRLIMPEGAIWPIAEAQTHRRFFKTHLPLDAVPLYDGVKYIHVARDGRDAALSLHNHLATFTPQAVAMADQVSLNDPKFAKPYLPMTKNARDFFHEWLEFDQVLGSDDELSFFHIENTYWEERKRPNVLLVHYNDLKSDLAGEMHRIAHFLEIDIDETLWPTLVEAAGFEAMRRNGSKIMPFAQIMWDGGSNTFLHKGTNGRWQDLYDPGDIEAYIAKTRADFSPTLRRWVESGRLVAGDPRLSD